MIGPYLAIQRVALGPRQPEVMPRVVHGTTEVGVQPHEEQWVLTVIRPIEAVEVPVPPLSTIDLHETDRPIEAHHREPVRIEVLHQEPVRIEVQELEAVIPIAEAVEAPHLERATTDRQIAIEVVAVPIEVLDAVVVAFQEAQEAQVDLPRDLGLALHQVEDETKSEIIINLL